MPPYIPLPETRDEPLPGLSPLPGLPVPTPSQGRGSAAVRPLRETVEEVPLRLRVSRWMQRLHDEITQFFEGRDGGGRFQEDAWLRPGGGGGVSRVLTEGVTFEKAGVNRFSGGGPIPGEMAARLGSTQVSSGMVDFFATGVSVVCHPRSPLVPIVHMNVRYFELRDGNGRRVDHWFGGGLDLTPTWPFPEDAVHFHRTLRRICNRHHPEYYRRFKAWCDDYFVNVHRGNERRGVGGIFFDNLRPGDAGELETEALFRFVQDVGVAIRPAYGAVVDRRKGLPWGEREKDFQLVRRGRYAEFNLVHDRGTRFGLQTNARIESVLMSMPPVARWGYALTYEEGSQEDRLMAMLEPRDWAVGVPESMTAQAP